MCCVFICAQCTYAPSLCPVTKTASTGAFSKEEKLTKGGIKKQDTALMCCLYYSEHG